MMKIKNLTTSSINTYQRITHYLEDQISIVGFNWSFWIAKMMMIMSRRSRKRERGWQCYRFMLDCNLSSWMELETVALIATDTNTDT